MSLKPPFILERTRPCFGREKQAGFQTNSQACLRKQDYAGNSRTARRTARAGAWAVLREDFRSIVCAIQRFPC
jgi:hypothetical protein